MKNVIDNSMPGWPLYIVGMSSLMVFVLSLIISLVPNSGISINWESGMLFVLCYGFLYIRDFLENAHF